MSELLLVPNLALTFLSFLSHGWAAYSVPAWPGVQRSGHDEGQTSLVRELGCKSHPVPSPSWNHSLWAQGEPP